MRAENSKGRGRSVFSVLAGVILIASLSACQSVHLTDDPGHGGVLKKTEHVVAVAAVEVLTSSNGGSVRNAWEDGNGMWHWTRVEPGVGTFRCEGAQVGIPKFCDRTSSP
jgi:hypothetical protein